MSIREEFEKGLSGFDLGFDEAIYEYKNSLIQQSFEDFTDGFESRDKEIEETLLLVESWMDLANKKQAEIKRLRDYIDMIEENPFHKVVEESLKGGE